MLGARRFACIFMESMCAHRNLDASRLQLAIWKPECDRDEISLRVNGLQAGGASLRAESAGCKASGAVEAKFANIG